MKFFLSALVLAVALPAAALAQSAPTRLPAVTKQPIRSVLKAVTKPAADHCEDKLNAAVSAAVADAFHKHCPAPSENIAPVVIEVPAAEPAAPKRPDDYGPLAGAVLVGGFLALCFYTRIH